jgi:hypothetical protein
VSCLLKLSSRKDPYTETALIALADSLSMVELLREFVEFPAVHQYCNAVVRLVTKGGGQTRTKRTKIRMNLGKETVNKNRVKVVYSKAVDERMAFKSLVSQNHKQLWQNC